MNQQDYITLFTVRIGAVPDANVKLFYNNKKKYVNEEVLDELLMLLNPNDSNNEDDMSLWNTKMSCFNSMSYENKIAAIRNHYNIESQEQDTNNSDTISVEEKINRLIGLIDNFPLFALKQIWTTQKSFIFENAGSRYSIYQAIEHDNVYAIDILTKNRSEKEWIPGLYKLVRKINPQATHINLLFHQGDIVEDHDYLNYTYVFSGEELKSILGETSDVSLNVMAFSHTSESPVYLVLREDFENKDKDIPEEVDSIHRKISFIAKDKAFRDNLLHTINGIKAGNDPIGNSYPKV